MKLTHVLWRWSKPLPGGHLWHGKYKLYKKVTDQDIIKKMRELQLEEKNMFYLRHPYLTLEQTKAYNKAFPLKYKKIAQYYDNKVNNWKDNEYIGDSFGFLKIRDRWE